MSGFKRIYYDAYSNKMYHWYYDDEGKTHKDELHPEIEYYVQDNTKKSPITDIFGNPVILQKSENIFAMKHVAEMMKTYETDIPEEVKFLQKTYKGKELKADLKCFNICTIDIEVESEGEFPEPEEVKYPIDLITAHFSKTDETHTFGLRDYTGNSPSVKNYHYCADEKRLIESFIELFRKQKVDIITGWYCISEGEFIWLQDKIVEIEKITNNNKLYENYGKIEKIYNTGYKENNKIVLSNGLEINCSSEHIFPIYYKDKKEYKNQNSLLKNCMNKNVEYISKHIKNKDFFLKVHIGKNKNKDYTIKELVVDNIEKMLNFNFFDIVISDKKLIKYIKDKKKIKCKSLDFKKRSNIWSFKNNSDVINLETFKKYLKNSDEFIFLFGNKKRKKRYNIKNVNEALSNELLRLLGFLFTDGSINEGNFVVYNTDIGNISFYNNLIYKQLKRFNKTNSIKYGKKNTKHENIWHKHMSYFNDFFLLMIMILDEKLNKNIDVEIMSKLSFEQFIAFFGGCIDGDGWISVEDNNIGFCNFENNIKKIANLLLWNGCYSNQYQTKLTIPYNQINTNFIKKIEIKHSERKICKNKIKFNNKKNSISNNIRYFIYDDYILISIKEIIKTNKLVNMFDITSESSYFVCNGIKTHNCRFFDIPYLINRCAKLKIEETLSPVGVYKENRAGGYHIERGGYIIGGISILDGRDLYKNFVYDKKVSYSLGAIGQEEVGEGKLQFEGTINTLWKTDWNKYVEYNIQDVALTRKIENKKKHIELAINFCYQALIPFDSIFSSISLISGYIIKYLHERNMVFPDKDKNQHKNEKSPGAYVMAKEGFFENVISFDVKSMYPHQIMTYNISPETLVIGKEYKLIVNGIEKIVKENDQVNVRHQDGKIEQIFIKNLQKFDEIL